MKKYLYTSVVELAILTTGCTRKAPDPVQIDKDLRVQINNSLLEKQYNFVPKDQFLSQKDWAYQMIFYKTNDLYIQNDEIAKAFLLAQNCQKMILIASNEELLDSYKQYFVENNVSAEIELQLVDWMTQNEVQVLFFNQVK